jgi:AraC-like DNA-binding protein
VRPHACSARRSHRARVLAGGGGAARPAGAAQRAGASVKRAAIEAGYRTPSAFVAAFRVSFKTTPGRYFMTGIDRRHSEAE